MCQFPCCELRQKNGACFVQALHYRRIGRNNLLPERRRTPRRWISAFCNKVLRSPRDSMQWSAVAACLDFCVSLFCLLQRQVIREGNYAFQYWVESLESIKIELCQLK